MIENKISIKNIKAIYLIGIKGVGMTALATICREMGFVVAGSDVDEQFVTDVQLKSFRITVYKGFNKKNIEGFIRDYAIKEVLIVATGAHNGMKNPEAIFARSLGFTVMLHGEALGFFSQSKKVIAISGSHGKTTTSAMVAHILVKSKKHPSFAVGAGNINSLGTSAHWDTGEYFVVEADEYINDIESDLTPRFLYLNPYISIITSIDFDHPDAFSSLEEVKKVFVTFANKTNKKGVVIMNNEDVNLRKIKPLISTSTVSYGTSENVDIRIGMVSILENKSQFTLYDKDKKLIKITISIPGYHNIQNAAAASIASFRSGISWKNIALHLKSFTGTKRRFEFIGKVNTITIIDDYAHHPREIIATIKAARSKYPQSRVIVLFQPHTFSRTKALFKDFMISFNEASIVGIADIFSSAREKPDKTISSRLLVDAMKKSNPSAEYIPDIQSFRLKIANNIQPNDILITMGAGDIYTWHGEIIKSLNH